MPIATIAFDFDPLLRLPADLVVRWQTVALAAVLVASMVAAVVAARRAGLRADDLLYIAVGVVPGAVVAGRIGYGVAHAEAFTGDPLRLIDPAVAGADLGAAVVGGLLTGAYVVTLLGAPVGRWAGVAALPLLLALGAGKLAMVLGGSGQGLPSEVAWSTMYLGPGPWGSLAPDVPSHPAQAYEGAVTLAWTIALIVVLGSAAAGRAARSRGGVLLLVAVGGWATIRAAVSLTWRDPPVLGPFGAAGWIAVLIALGAFLGAIALGVRSRGRPATSPSDTLAGPSWPDPDARPPF